MAQLMVSHGKVTHSIQGCHDCVFCLEIEIEYLKELKKAGGKKKFIKQLKKKL